LQRSRLEALGMELLREIPTDGFPTDYLVARVRGRRAELLAQRARGRSVQQLQPGSDEAIWDALLAEFDWLRRQMNPRLRRDLAPVFTLFVIKTLVLCLRNKAAERQATVERLLHHELLAEELRDAVVSAPEPGAAVAAVAEAVGALAGDARPLAAAYVEGGLKGLETRLMRDFLGRVVGAPCHPAVRRFFVSFIDLRNVMTLYKHLRWGFHDAAAFVPGGTLATSRLADASARGDTGGLDACVREITGEAAPTMAASEVALESRLLSSVTRRLRAAGRRSGDDVELILDYLWSVYVEARNRAVRLHAADVDAATLEQELIA
jgi:vacuolar-type H+-ATPase subunit C/Vma6